MQRRCGTPLEAAQDGQTVSRFRSLGLSASVLTALRCLWLLSPPSRLRHRGPDWGGSFFHGRHALLHERLAVVDPASGAQPLLNSAGDTALAVNGEIYNHMQLRNILKPGHVFSTASDCEIVLHLYEDFGDECVKVSRNCRLLCTGSCKHGFWESGCG